MIMKDLICIKEGGFGMSEGGPGSKGFSVITDLEMPLDFSINQEEADKPIPILPLRNMVLFPKVIAPIIVGRDSSMKLVRQAEK